MRKGGNAAVDMDKCSMVLDGGCMKWRGGKRRWLDGETRDSL